MTTENVSEAAPEAVVNPLIAEPKTQPGITQLWQPWTLIIPALLVLPLLGLAVSWQISPSIDETLTQPSRRYVEAKPEMPLQPSSEVPIFVPGNDQLLHRRSIKNSLNIKPEEMPTALGTGQRLTGVAALQKLFAAAPDYFPPGTQVEELTLEQAESGQNIAHVSLNDTFWNSDYWMMDSRAPVTIQAIAHTLADAYQSAPADFRVLLLRGNQNPGHLGQDDIADPIPLDENILGEPTAAATPVPASPAVTWPAPKPHSSEPHSSEPHSSEPTPTATVAAP